MLCINTLRVQPSTFECTQENYKQDLRETVHDSTPSSTVLKDWELNTSVFQQTNSSAKEHLLYKGILSSHTNESSSNMDGCHPRRKADRWVGTICIHLCKIPRVHRHRVYCHSPGTGSSERWLVYSRYGFLYFNDATVLGLDNGDGWICLIMLNCALKWQCLSSSCYIVFREIMSHYWCSF